MEEMEVRVHRKDRIAGRRLAYGGEDDKRIAPGWRKFTAGMTKRGCGTGYRFILMVHRGVRRMKGSPEAALRQSEQERHVAYRMKLSPGALEEALRQLE